MRRSALLLLAGSSLALSGCAASIAASAVGAAVRASAPARPTDDRRGAATTACTERAALYGSVHIIDADQRPDGRVTVWGTVEDDRQRLSFECRYNGRVAGFRLRPIAAR